MAGSTRVWLSCSLVPVTRKCRGMDAKGCMEFDFIDQCLKPLCAPRALADDTSVAIGGQALVVNTDTIVEGRHFLSADPADSVAKKLVRVNISDLASTGARPQYLSLAMSLGHTADERWLRHFAAGLAEDLSEFGLTLLGGDTTRSDGASVFSAHMIGNMETRRPMRRWQARSGDDVWLGRPLGLGGLGLADAQAGRSSPYAWRYWVPSPQLDLGLKLSGLDARIACADVAQIELDGLASRTPAMILAILRALAVSGSLKGKIA